ncbi:MAG: ubiquinone/menaquinone biosynthesis methyltransferase [Candidatus Cloacimonetes bacterium]|nr:ubiquinone/menaquinone biosynthesis methyltransferase [Candidatus Cloacimonadota bacterium]
MKENKSNENHENLRKRTSHVRKLFSRVPKTYEKINHILTFGFDIKWRKSLVRIALKSDSGNWIDMCTGTGETAVYLSRSSPKGTKIFAVDLTPEMLQHAKTKPEAKDIEFTCADIKSLPFADNYFDLITMTFATRNINLNKNILIKSFSEFQRVLKPGGFFINLETSQPDNSLIRRIFHLYINLLVKLVGTGISGSKPAYSYLAHTIPKFYTTEELSGILQESGFSKISFRKLLFGIAAIHKCYKLKK